MIKLKKEFGSSWGYYGKCNKNWCLRIPSLTALSLLSFQFSAIKDSIKIAIRDNK